MHSLFFIAGVAYEGDSYNIPSIAISKEVDLSIHHNSDYKEMDWEVPKKTLKDIAAEVLKNGFLDQVSIASIGSPPPCLSNTIEFMEAVMLQHEEIKTFISTVENEVFKVEHPDKGSTLHELEEGLNYYRFESDFIDFSYTAFIIYIISWLPSAAIMYYSKLFTHNQMIIGFWFCPIVATKTVPAFDKGLTPYTDWKRNGQAVLLMSEANLLIIE